MSCLIAYSFMYGTETRVNRISTIIDSISDVELKKGRNQKTYLLMVTCCDIKRCVENNKYALVNLNQ